MKVIKGLLVGFVVLMNMAFCLAQPSQLDIRLITVSEGDQFYNIFGHSAVRVVDYRHERDLVFDFGLFDFSEPNFLMRFLLGDLKYAKGVSSFEQFMQSYDGAERAIVEEALSLSPEDKLTVYDQLLHEVKPENHTYQYDFIRDNCSTRIRDIVLQSKGISMDKIYEPAGLTYRENLFIYLAHRFWIKLGTDLLLGQRVDEAMSYGEAMFLPDGLSKHLKLISLASAPYQTILQPSKILKDRHSRERKSYFPKLTWLIGLVIWAAGLWFDKSKRTTNLLFATIGLTGLFLTFMWFGTSHYFTKINWNLAWANPLLLVLLFRNRLGKPFYSILIWGLIVINGALLLFWNLLPQAINPYFIPIFILMLLALRKELISLRSSAPK